MKIFWGATIIAFIIWAIITVESAMMDAEQACRQEMKQQFKQIQQELNDLPPLPQVLE